MAGRFPSLVRCLIALPTMATAATVSPAVRDPIAAAKKEYDAILSATHEQKAPAESPRESVPPLTIEQELPAALSPMQRARQSENRRTPSNLPTSKNWLQDTLDDGNRSSTSQRLRPKPLVSETVAGITPRSGRGATKLLNVGEAAFDSSPRDEPNVGLFERATALNPFSPFLSSWMTKSDFNLLIAERSASDARSSDQPPWASRDSSIAPQGQQRAAQLTQVQGLTRPFLGPARAENPYLAALTVASAADQVGVSSLGRQTSPGTVFEPALGPVTKAPKLIEESRSSAPSFATPDTLPQIKQLKRF